ncbi:SOS response-associated peptidase [Chlorobium sp. KB01]|uniref:SOS response-associated peptidase n=1 Tax=Chlorobium sp. KB01 TaxID=1917528 RepID=UPI000975ACFB|nr:SOS response-associated peptidase [Chlorobium sp. KB01]
MCGRFGFFELKYFIEQLRQLELPFEEEEGFVFHPGYNIAPESRIVTLLAESGRYTLAEAHWGLIPHWAREMPKVRPINARAESLSVKPYFRHMLNRRHCLIPASGFYEWQRSGGAKKQPYYIHRVDGRPMAFAGLWESWQPVDAAEAPVRSCTIITTRANHQMAPVHDRMPVILEPENWRQWLQAGKPGAEKLLEPSGEGTLDIYPVSTRVNNPQYIRRDCITHLDAINPD